MISITLDTATVDALVRDLQDLSGNTLDRAMTRSVNRAADSVSTAVSRELRDITGLSYGKVREDVHVTQRANTGNLEAVITIEGGYHGVGEFHPHETEEGISADPWGTRRLFSHTFFIPGAPSVVFRREGVERLPIKPLFGPSLAVEAMRDERISDIAMSVAQETFNARIQHELDRLVTTGKPRASEEAS